jgi:hypothetical protein
MYLCLHSASRFNICHAQSLAEINPLTSSLHDSLLVQTPDSFGFGVYATVGDATLMQIVPTLDFFYRHSFSRVSSLQVSFSYTGEALLQRMTTAGQFAFLSTEIGKSSMLGITGFFTLNKFWEIGLGIFVRHRTHAYFSAVYPFLQDTGAAYFMDYGVGFQAVTEYTLLSLEPVEVFISGKVLCFVPPFAGDAVLRNQTFYNFPANLDLRPPGFTSTIGASFRHLTHSPPIMASCGISARIRF